ncbi:ferrochelatase [Thermogutta sp.]|jgi:ferrochelatase|uniref:ferrochelatase n=1 Tax=Thermogutta sp. TaxID=1962930 RepID=UPI003C7C3090
MAQAYDAILLVSFGGPERAEDVMPFLKNVARGRNISEARLKEVAEHYYHLGGRSPINDHCRALKKALEDELARRGWRLPIYWGNRNWHPFLEEAIDEMVKNGVRRALAVVTSVFGSYSSCRRYLEDLTRAREVCGAVTLEIDRLRLPFNHPGFVAAMVDRVREAHEAAKKAGFVSINLIFTAHSIPVAMAAGSPYLTQFEEASRLVAEAAGFTTWRLAYQSRSGPPHVPWLEPDILDVLRSIAEKERAAAVVVAPIGFLSDHVEVLYDLDVEASTLARELEIGFFRAGTVGTHPAFVAGLCQMIEERLDGRSERRAIGRLPACADVCPVDCCPPS